MAEGACGVLTALMMDTASTSETSVKFYQATWRNNPEANRFQEIHCINCINLT
jgi:hypothetical protein